MKPFPVLSSRSPALDLSPLRHARALLQSCDHAVPRTAQHGTPDGDAGADRCGLFAAHCRLSPDGLGLCSGRPALRETDGMQESAFSLQIEPIRQCARCLLDVFGQLPLDAACSLVRDVLCNPSVLLGANTENALAGHDVYHAGDTSASLAREPVVEQDLLSYQVLYIGYSSEGLMIIRAAGHYYQRIHTLSNTAIQATSDPKLQGIRDYYDLPYRIHPGPNEVAIVGSGTGNDVADVTID